MSHWDLPVGTCDEDIHWTLNMQNSKLKQQQKRMIVRLNACGPPVTQEDAWESRFYELCQRSEKAKNINKLIVCLTFCSASFSHVFLSRFHCNVVVYLARLHGRVGTCESSSRYYLYGTPLQRFHRSWQNAMLFRLFSPWCAHMCVRATLCAVIKFKLAVLFCEVFLVPSKTCVCTL